MQAGSSCISTGDTSWVLFSTVLVLGMMPALGFFEAGMLRAKNTLSVLTQTFSGVLTLSVMWVLFGYSLTFGPSQGGVIGSFKFAFLTDVSYYDCNQYAPTIPAACYALFMMMFAAITPLLMTGAYAGRMRFKAFFVFTILWEIFIYYPVAHWIWGEGFMSGQGDFRVLDFAGGIVIHTTAGVASLVCALVIGKRVQFHEYDGMFPASSMPLAAVGAALLWMGWFGFNGGSALSAGPVAVSAIVSTQLACAVSALCWIILSWAREKPSMSAIMNGALAGLAGITPASGYVDTQATLVLGAVFGISSYFGAHWLKHKLGVDDALEVTVIHGLTGVLGSLGLGIFSSLEVNAEGVDGWWYGNPTQFGYQWAGVLIAGTYAGIMTYIILKVVDHVIGIRISKEAEMIGLDWIDHEEIAYHELHVLEEPESRKAAQLYNDSANRKKSYTNLPTNFLYKRSHHVMAHIASEDADHLASDDQMRDTSRHEADEDDGRSKVRFATHSANDVNSTAVKINRSKNDSDDDELHPAEIDSYNPPDYVALPSDHK